MDYEDWKPVYEALLTDFGYPKDGDERARDRLRELLIGRQTFDPASLAVADQTVAVAGGGPSLLDETEIATDADLVFAASTAAERLIGAGVDVDLIVTDLDKHPAEVVEHTHDGIPVTIHAHGDNLDLVEETVPECDPAFVLPTTQAAPSGPVRNFGGFTDGDRAAFVADHFGATELRFLGWDFDDDAVSAEKERKLEWAQRLLYWLEVRRGERFSILDGRRHGVDTSVLPVE